MGVRGGDVAGLALDSVPEHQRAQPPATRLLRRGGQGVPRRGQHDHLVAGEARLIRLGRLGDRPVAAGEQVLPDGDRHFDVVPGEYFEGVVERRRVGHGGAGGDDRRIVAGDVADEVREHPGRVGRGGETTALDRREVLADAVDLVDRRPTPQECLVDGPLVVESDAGRRRREQRRAAAADQADEEIVLFQSPRQLENPRGGGASRGVRHRVSGLDDLDLPGRHAVAVACDHQPREPVGGTAPSCLEGGGHGGRRLAGPDDDHAAGGPGQRPIGQELSRVDCRDCVIEQRAEEPPL